VHQRLERQADRRLEREHRKAGNSTVNLSTLIGRSQKEWTRPTFEMPALTNPASLTPLGELRGRKWWRHASYGELEERPDTLRDDDPALPFSVIVQDDSTGEWRYRTFAIHAPGTFERLSNPTTRRRARPAPPHRPVDSLAGLHLIMPMTPGMATIAPGPRSAVRGPEAILARLAAKGATVSLSVDGSALVVESAGGRPHPGVPELVKESAPLLVGHLRGEPLRCTAGKHKGEAPAAVTVVLGGAVACAAHMDGVA
jgi:hypothetical protein